MRRSPVKTGLHVQRSRATTRRRDRGEEPPPLPNRHEQLWAWLQSRLSSVQDINTLSRKRFLQETGHLNVPPGERLRQLAIFADEEVLVPRGAGHWFTLRSIYQQALRFNEPDLWLVHYSMAHSVANILVVEDLEPAVREQIAAEGIAAGLRAVELAPDRPETHHILGLCYYRTDRPLEALACFEAGAATDRNDGWTALFRAYTLHDLRRWDEAVRAYDAVPLDFFKGPVAWRVDLLKEYRAWCKLQQGDRGGALADFLALLARYEAQPVVAGPALNNYLVRAAAGPLRVELHQRVLALIRQLEQLDQTGRPVGMELDPGWAIRELESARPLDPVRLAWIGGSVVKLAQSICEGRTFDLLPILADGLEEAGCSDNEILGHLRGAEPHWRGCWIVDLISMKE
jgi:tetratricopeptide (TPR) repeat protein